MTKLLQVKNISKGYDLTEGRLDILKNISFDISAGDRVAIVGKSGSGKTTLLSIISGLEKPSSGQVFFEGLDLFNQPKNIIENILNQDIGFVYQFHHLLPECTALENVMLPFLIRGKKNSIVTKQAEMLLAQVGLQDRMSHFPSKLSGGERQRVAIARALISDPKCVFLDEPTGNLDSTASDKIWQLIDNLCKARNTAFIVVTHDKELANKADFCLQLKDGNINITHNA